MAAITLTTDQILEIYERAKELYGEKALTEMFFIDATARSFEDSKFTDFKIITAPGVPPKQFNISFKDEIHVGVIIPTDDASVAIINATRGAFPPIKKRDKERNPTINFQQYPHRRAGDNGQCSTSPPEEESKVYKVFKIMADSLNAILLPRIKRNEIVDRDSLGVAAPNPLIVHSIKTKNCIQTHVSIGAPSNPGVELPNKICRVTIKFDKKTGFAKSAKFFDGLSEVADDDGIKRYSTLKLDDEDVSTTNVHKIQSRSRVNGIIKVPHVCFSHIGISIPTDFIALVIFPPASFSKMTTSEIFGCLDRVSAAPQRVLDAAPDPEVLDESLDAAIHGLGIDDNQRV